MTVLVLGISHRSAPISMLDKVALDAAAVDDVLRRAYDGQYIDGVSVLATCNRLEIIADARSFHGGLADLGSALVDVIDLPWAELAEHIYVQFDEKALNHVLTVAAGLDSMAIGESQILGQLRHSFQRSQQHNTLSSSLSYVLQQALRVGKRAHSETGLDSVARSLLDTALSAAQGHVGELSTARTLVVGAGAMSGLAVANLHRGGAKSITVINRTMDRAERLVAEVGGRAVELTPRALAEEIAAADVIVSCTGARGVVLGREDIIAGLSQDDDDQPKKFFIDLALPHDIDPRITEFAHVRLLGLEDIGALLSDTSTASNSAVVEAIEHVRSIIRAELKSLLADKRARRIAPTVTALRSMVSEIVSNEVSRLETRLAGNLDDRMLAEVKKSLHRVADKLVHTPTVRVKELSAQDTGIDYAAALTSLFDLPTRAVASTGAAHGLTGAHGGAVAGTTSGVHSMTTPDSAEPKRSATATSHKHVTTDGLRPVADHTLDIIEPARPVGKTVRLGTRRSKLARAQSTAIAQELAALTGWRVEIVEVVTEGDVNMTPLASLGGTGVFVSAVRNALLSGSIDIAVHSLKDLPTAAAPGIALAAIPPRVDPADVLIARDGLSLRDLPAGAVIGTGSPRRAAQLRAARPDIEVRGVRGNVDTRIGHVEAGRLDAVVLAAAGIRRLGRLAEASDILTAEVMLPAPGQGALAVECRGADSDLGAEDAEIRAALDHIHDESTALAVNCERAILARAEAGCSAPIGALATVSADTIAVTAVMADDTGKLSRVSKDSPLPTSTDDRSKAAHELGVKTAQELLESLGIDPRESVGANAPQEHVPVSVSADGSGNDEG